MVINTVSAGFGGKVVYDFDARGVVFSFEGDIEGMAKGLGATLTPPALMKYASLTADIPQACSRSSGGR